jgi:lipopolysaccharide assembly protein A
VRAVYWSGVIILAVAITLLAVSNREVVSLGLWPLSVVAEAPLYLVIVASLVFGVLIGAVAAWIKGGRRRHELRECRRQNAALTRELAANQAQPGREPRTSQPASPS